MVRDDAGDARPKPRPLQLEALHAPALSLPDWCHDEMPVRKTFIDYRCPEESPRGGQTSSGLNTAPASLCGCVLASLEEAASTPHCPDRGQRSAGVLEEACSAASTARRSETSSSSSQASKPAAPYRIPAEKFNRCEGAARGPEEATSKLLIHTISTDEDCGSSPDEDEEEDLNICPVYSATAALPSVGSAAHAEGACRRCCFFPKGRCNNGKDCLFCHFLHEKRRSKPKPKKNNKSKSKKRPGNVKEEVLGAGRVETRGSQGSVAPVSIVLQNAIPAVPEGSQSSGQSFGMAIVSVPFCVGAY